MAQKKDTVTKETMVAERTIDEWNGRWIEVPRGFLENQPQLNYKIGLWAAKRGDLFFYIATAITTRGYALNQGLGRVRTTNSGGDGGHGLKMVRKYKEDLKAFVIIVNDEDGGIETAIELNKKMKVFHDPEVNQSEEIISAEIQKHYRE